MIVEYIRYKIKSDSWDAFIKAYEAASSALKESEVCLGYELSQCEEEPERSILRIEWTSTEDHMQTFRSSPQFRSFLPHIRPFIGNIEEMQHYKLTSVTSDRESAG